MIESAHQPETHFGEECENDKVMQLLDKLPAISKQQMKIRKNTLSTFSFQCSSTKLVMQWKFQHLLDIILVFIEITSNMFLYLVKKVSRTQNQQRDLANRRNYRRDQTNELAFPLPIG